MIPETIKTEGLNIKDDVLVNNDLWNIREFVLEDLNDVCNLCREAFPIEYPQEWYIDVVNGCYISFGLYHNNNLTSLLVAENTTIGECDLEDKSIHNDPNVNVIYILSLAVSQNYKRRGLATILLKHLMSKINTYKQQLPKLMFLHVLSDNLPAISFYRKNGFYHHATLPNYYLIGNKFYDGLTFVKHLNLNYCSFNYLLTSIYKYCTSIIEFFASPFRKCIANDDTSEINKEKMNNENLVSICSNR
ncbi:N-acetyltransferase domain-containing protein [Meloidogyne graminicola]|uniref:N-alpha-acetyltransferase 60 n=1 Tax=Meloidogyne graminicola TaxID=189291 RepID=A0A8S9ZN72_9BILA|nr:N-acetyltransferase domain-containing protein [Meloidogyne graminicola]